MPGWEEMEKEPEQAGRAEAVVQVWQGTKETEREAD